MDKLRFLVETYIDYQKDHHRLDNRLRSLPQNQTGETFFKDLASDAYEFEKGIEKEIASEGEFLMGKLHKIDLSIIFKNMPNFNDYLTEEKRETFKDDDGGFIYDLENWKESSLSLIRGVKEQLEEILNSDLMREASKFTPWVKEKWIGELAIILEFLDEAEKEGS